MINQNAEEQIVYQRDQEWLNVKTVEEVADFLTEDFTIIPGGMPPVRGRDRALAWYGEFLDSVIEKYGTTDRIEIAASGDLAYARGTITMKLQGPDGPIEDEGTYVIVYRKEGDKWMGVIDIFNSNLPQA